MNNQEDKNEFGYTAKESEEARLKMEASMVKDFDGSRRRYADQVSTSEALRRRAAAGKRLTMDEVLRRAEEDTRIRQERHSGNGHRPGGIEKI